jgi:hypothetical protein
MKKELQNEEITRIIVNDLKFRKEKTLSHSNAKTKARLQSNLKKMMIKI